MFKRLQQFFCNHAWNKTRGYEERPKTGAVCAKCQKVSL